MGCKGGEGEQLAARGGGTIGCKGWKDWLQGLERLAARVRRECDWMAGKWGHSSQRRKFHASVRYLEDASSSANSSSSELRLEA